MVVKISNIDNVSQMRVFLKSRRTYMPEPMKSHLNVRSELNPQVHQSKKKLENTKDSGYDNTLIVNQKDWDFILEMIETPIELNNSLTQAVQNYHKFFD